MKVLRCMDEKAEICIYTLFFKLPGSSFRWYILHMEKSNCKESRETYHSLGNRCISDMQLISYYLPIKRNPSHLPVLQRTCHLFYIRVLIFLSHKANSHSYLLKFFSLGEFRFTMIFQSHLGVVL